MYQSHLRTAAKTASKLPRLCLDFPADERLAIINHNCKLLIQERFGWARAWTNFIDLDSRPEVEEAVICEIANGATAPMYSMRSHERAYAAAHQYAYLPVTTIPGTHILSHAGRHKAAIRPPPRKFAGRSIRLPTIVPTAVSPPRGTGRQRDIVKSNCSRDAKRR